MKRLPQVIGGLICCVVVWMLSNYDLVKLELTGKGPDEQQEQTVHPDILPGPGGTVQNNQAVPQPNNSPMQQASASKIHGEKVKATWTGRVVKVSDGDTVTVLNANSEEVKVRLGGIDAPEKKQAFGSVAKQALSDWVFNKIVVVREVSTDRYGRKIGFLDVDGSDINASLVWAGYAWEYKSYSKSSVMGGYENDARQQKRGLWVDANPTPPWEFRR